MGIDLSDTEQRSYFTGITNRPSAETKLLVDIYLQRDTQNPLFGSLVKKGIITLSVEGQNMARGALKIFPELA